MAEPSEPKPQPAKDARSEREVRLAQALRDNLRRRKTAGRSHAKKPSED